MSTELPGPKTSRGMRIGGWIMGALPALFFLVMGAINLSKPEAFVKKTVESGLSENLLQPLGAIMVTCAILYLIPQTAVLGAVLLTGYLGGAIATHVTKGDPLNNILLPTVMGALFWGGLWLRDARVRALLPLRW